jgi:hypothetical protein
MIINVLIKFTVATGRIAQEEHLVLVFLKKVKFSRYRPKQTLGDPEG